MVCEICGRVTGVCEMAIVVEAAFGTAVMSVRSAEMVVIMKIWGSILREREEKAKSNVYVLQKRKCWKRILRKLHRLLENGTEIDLCSGAS